MEHLLRIANDFSACTHLTTRAFDRFGRCLGVAADGADIAGAARSAKWQGVISAALGDLPSNAEKGYVLTRAAERDGDTWFIACYADPVAPELGSFAIGPFSSRGASRYPKKPLTAVAHLVGLLNDIAQDVLIPSPSADHPSEGPLQRALEAIHRTFPSSISMDDICREVGISKPGLCRVFRRELGITFCAYVHRLRVERGKLLLRDQSYSILDVALAAGFCDQSYFNRIFKRETGQTPRRYRNALQAVQ